LGLVPEKVVLESGEQILPWRVLGQEWQMKTYRQNVGVKGIKINGQVDTCICECLHASVVILGSIDVIDAERVGAELLHQGGITLTLLGINQRILRPKLVRNAWGCQYVTTWQ
jgi:hypothetical protein